VTLSDLQPSLIPYCKLFICDFSCSCAAFDRISTDSVSRGPSAVAELLVIGVECVDAEIASTGKYEYRKRTYKAGSGRKMQVLKTQVRVRIGRKCKYGKRKYEFAEAGYTSTWKYCLLSS